MKKAFYGLLCIILAGAVAFFGCFFGIPEFNALVKNAFKSDVEISNPKNPDDNKDSDNKDPDGDGDNSGGNSVSSGSSVITENENYGIALLSEVISCEAYEAYGISAQADSAYTLTAQYSPAGATDIWEWSITGNEDEAITLSGYGMSATVTCNKAFDVKKVITVSSQSNPSVKASCTVDYYKRLESVTVAAPEIIKLSVDDLCMVDVGLVPHYGKGTILDTTVTMNSLSMKIISPMVEGSARSSNGSEAKATATVKGDFMVGSSTGVFDFNFSMSPERKSPFFELTRGAEYAGIYEAYYKWFINQCNYYRADNHFEITVGWYASRPGAGTFNNGTVTAQGKFDVSGLTINANNVTMGDTNILF